MMQKNDLSKSILIQLISGIVLLIIILICLKVFIHNVEPTERQHHAKKQAVLDDAVLLNELTPEKYQHYFELIKNCTKVAYPGQETRRVGTLGCEATANLISETLANCGMQVITQHFSVSVPSASNFRLLGENNESIENLFIYPVEPSGILTVSLPSDGLQGKLVFIEKSDLALLQGENPEDLIVLTYSFDWKTFASMGVKAVLILEDTDMRSLRTSKDTTDPWNSLIERNEFNYPLFLVRGDFRDLIGKRVKLQGEVKWQTVTAKNIFGRLQGKENSSEALLISAYYDSFSPIIGMAPGAEEAISVAAFLNLAKALAPYKGKLQRDVIFIATSAHSEYAKGARVIMDALETNMITRVDKMSVRERLASQETLLSYVKNAKEIIENDIFWNGEPSETKVMVNKYGNGFKTWFSDVVKHVLGEINIADTEKVLQRRLAYLRAGSPVYREGFDPIKASDKERRDKANSHPLLLAYLDAREKESISGNMVSIQPHLLCTKPETASLGVKNKLLAHLERLEKYHTKTIKELSDSIAVHELISKYQNKVLINLQIYSGGSLQKNSLAILTGKLRIGSIIEPQVSILADIFRKNCIKTGTDTEIIHWSSLDASGTKVNPSIHGYTLFSMESVVWTIFGHLAFTVINSSFFPAKIGTPENTFEDIDISLPQKQMPAIGKTILDIAAGDLQLKSMPSYEKNNLIARSVKVVGNAGSGSLSPSHRFGENTFVVMYKGGFGIVRGVKNFMIEQTDPYGECSFDKFLPIWGHNYDFNAMRFDEKGNLLYTKNQISSFATTGKKVTIPMFRCAPVSVYAYQNPVTMQSFKGISFISKQTLSSPDAFLETPYVYFLKPDLMFYIVLKDGAYGNKEILANRAFILNANPYNPPIQPDEPEIFGEGYLVADTPFIGRIAEQASASMLRTNQKRIQLQQKYNMADSLMLEFHNKALAFLKDAQEAFANFRPLESAVAASKSFAYALNNHPIIRNKISQAIIGILWYLALLVPFAFFFEKLVFGFTDIRKQLVSIAIIFLIVFFLLKIFHPAFQMVRSSLMILLGFIILLLTLIVILMVSGKFKQNIKELRSKEGVIEGADINRGGVIGTAFMLGLNNMRRRKVRTALTATTLILLTFVMICFTSISSSLVDNEVAVGKSQWNGIIFRKDYFAPLMPDEVSAINRMYEKLYPITSRSWLIYNIDDARTINNAEFNIDREVKVGETLVQRRAVANAILKLNYNEPMFTSLDKALLTTNGWFPAPPATREELKQFIKENKRTERLVILPDAIAEALNISAKEVNEGNVYVIIRNYQYRVLGIIDSQDLAVFLKEGIDFLSRDNSLFLMGEVFCRSI